MGGVTEHWLLLADRGPMEVQEWSKHEEAFGLTTKVTTNTEKEE